MLNESILLTGATGFVGSHVVAALSGKASRVRALVRATSRLDSLETHGIEPLVGSLEDADSVRRAIDGVDVVVHMAAATRAANEKEFARVNGEGTEAVLRGVIAARKPPRRVVYLSSLAAVGPAREGRPVRAEDPPAPLTAYGRTKLAGELILRGLPADIEVAILRAPAVYGPRDRDMYEFFKMADKGILPMPTGPVRRLQLVHAADLARAVVLAATAERAAGVYHIAEQRAYLWEEVARLVARAVGREARLITVPASLLSLAGAVSEVVSRVTGKPSIFSRDKARELLAPGWLCETERALQELGFRAEIPLDRGFAETAEWYRAHGWL